MLSENKVNIYIDGGNFHHLALKKIGGEELNFDFEAFANFLSETRIIPDMGKRFYVGTVREKAGDGRSKEIMARQTKLFTLLRASGWELKTSKLRLRTEKITIDARVEDFKNILKAGIKEIKMVRIREKGIDVKIATDLIVGALDNKYDTAILVSSDTDLVPAMDWVRKRLNKKIEYIGFSIENNHLKEKTMPSQGMISHSDIQRILVQSDIEKFMHPSLFR